MLCVVTLPRLRSSTTPARSRGSGSSDSRWASSSCALPTTSCPHAAYAASVLDPDRALLEQAKAGLAGIFHAVGREAGQDHLAHAGSEFARPADRCYRVGPHQWMGDGLGADEGVRHHAAEQVVLPADAQAQRIVHAVEGVGGHRRCAPVVAGPDRTRRRSCSPADPPASALSRSWCWCHDPGHVRAARSGNTPPRGAARWLWRLQRPWLRRSAAPGAWEGVICICSLAVEVLKCWQLHASAMPVEAAGPCRTT